MTSDTEAKPETTRLAEDAAPARKGLGVLVRLVISVGAIALVLSLTNFNEAIAHAKTQTLWLAALAALALGGQLVFGALRWHWIRTGLGAAVRFLNSLVLFAIGSFFGAYVLSGLSGDFMRVFLSVRGGVDLGRATQSVVLDRIVAVASIAGLMLVCAPWFILRFGAGVGAWAPVLAAVGLVAVIIAAAQVRRLPERWLHWLPVRLARGLGEAVRDIFMRPRVAARAIFAAMIAQAFYTLAAWCLAQSLGVNVPLVDCFAIMQIVAITSAVPISVGGWGVREVSMVAGFALVGIQSSAALLVSVELGLLNLAVNLPGGLLWLFKRSDNKIIAAPPGAGLRPEQP